MHNGPRTYATTAPVTQIQAYRQGLVYEGSTLASLQCNALGQEVC